MKTLQLGSIALLLLCGFISCKKDSLSTEKIDGGLTEITAASDLSTNATLSGGGCPECVENFTSTSQTAASNAVFSLSGTTFTAAGTTLKTVATTDDLYTAGNVNVTVSHDADNIYFTLERNNTTGGFGNFSFLSPATGPIITSGPNKTAVNGVPIGTKKIQVVRSRTALGPCSSISFAFGVKGGGSSADAGDVTSPVLNYVLRDLCPPSCSIEVGDYRTQTRGYWRNNNGQAFLSANNNVFNLTIGDAGNTKTFTTPASVKEYLEGNANGTPGVLPEGRTFGAQVLTLLINVTADEKVADFSAVDGKLAKLVVNIDDADIAAHPSWAALASWNGRSVGDILLIAQKVLGGTSTEYSPSHMNELVTAINENYDNGTVDTGFLTCGK